jgi:hypothetical protein
MTAAERALALLAHLRVDEDSDQILESLVGAWTDGLERPAQVAHSETGGPWEALTNPERAPLWALPHAAQWTGGTIPARQSAEDDTAYLLRARAEVLRPRGMLRGAYSALVTTIQAHLTGSRFVSIVEWIDESAWKLAARVRDEECADPAAVYAAANHPSAIPAGMHVAIVESSGQVWDELDTPWDDLLETWDAL